MVLLAMGFVGPGQNKLVDELNLVLDKRGNIATDSLGMTNIKGIFAAGDTTTGQSLIVRAIDHGRKTAKGIMKYLYEMK